MVGAAPAALDTIYELASAISNNANISTTLLNLIANKAPISQPAFLGTVTTTGDISYNGGSSLIALQNTAITALTTASATQTALSTYQPRNTNLNNVNNIITAPASYYSANFRPRDIVGWVGGVAVNNAETVTNAWGIVEHTAQMLTLTSTANYDYRLNITNSYAGVLLNLRVWVKLGTASIVESLLQIPQAQTYLYLKVLIILMMA